MSKLTMYKYCAYTLMFLILAAFTGFGYATLTQAYDTAWFLLKCTGVMLAIAFGAAWLFVVVNEVVRMLTGLDCLDWLDNDDGERGDDHAR